MKAPTLIALCGLLAGAVATAAAAPVVVLDPGHGGSNPGATGTTGLAEKQLTLAIAGRVAERLRGRGVTVQQTRTTDRTLTLRQRIAIADRLPADLFVSIHANASPTRAQRGFETYVLSARGVDVDGRALRSDTTTPRPGVDPAVGLVLDDELWERQGDAHMALGHYHDAVEAYSRRLTTLRAPTERAWLSSKVGFVEFKQGNFSRAIEVLEGVLGSLGARLPWLAASLRLWIVLSIVRSLLPPRRWRGSLEAVKVAIRTHVLLAECYHMNMVPVRAAYHSATAAYLARRLGASTDSVRALSINGLGLLLYGQRRIGLRQLAQARAYMQAVAVPESVRCRLEVSAALGSLAQGEVGRALEQLEDAWRRFGAAASAEARVYVLSMLTYLLIATGHDPRRCEHYIRRMLALAEELHDDRTLAVAYVHRGYMLACAGRFLDAIEPLRRGQRLAHKVGDHANELRASDLLTIALTIENGIDEALERGRAAAQRSLTALGSHSYMSRDAGLLVVATELVRRGRPLTKEDDALVRRLLRRRRKGAVALPSGATLFRVAEAAWHAAHGRAHTGAASAIAHAGRLGLDGEASLGRHVALYLEGKKPAWTLHSESTAFAPAHEPMAPPVAR